MFYSGYVNMSLQAKYSQLHHLSGYFVYSMSNVQMFTNIDFLLGKQYLELLGRHMLIELYISGYSVLIYILAAKK